MQAATDNGTTLTTDQFFHQVFAPGVYPTDEISESEGGLGVLVEDLSQDIEVPPTCGVDVILRKLTGRDSGGRLSRFACLKRLSVTALDHRLRRQRCFRDRRLRIFRTCRILWIVG